MDAGEIPFELAVVGAGYVGLVTAACLSTLGFTVRSIDSNEQRVRGLQRGVLPFFEPGLADAVKDGRATGRLTFATSIAATHGAAAAFIAVGTLDANGEWSARDVERAVTELAADVDAPRTLIVRSTLMPGTTARLAAVAQQLDPRIEIATNPEFTRQGTALSDFLHPDRVVIGLTRRQTDSRALHILRHVYAAAQAPIVVTDAASAELIKVGSNVFLALKAGFANEIARLSAAAGADVADVVDGIGLDGRIGRAFMTPGPGVGGSCLPSQSRSVPATADIFGVDVPILDAVDRSNATQTDWVAEQVERAVGGVRGKRIAVLGLTFKQGTDDVRESPALRVCRVLSERGASVCGHDPMGNAGALAAAEHDGYALEVAVTAADAACNVHAIVVATDWPEYRLIDWAAVAPLMSGNTVIDTRAAIDPAAARAAGLNVIVHGRVISDPT